MMSSSGETSPDSADGSVDADSESISGSEQSFENPNYRKLYANLSITSMMGQNRHQLNGLNGSDALDALSADNQQTTDASGAQPELPIGWERHEDEIGPYFWHIPSGTIQRDPPFDDRAPQLTTKRDSLIYFGNFDENFDSIKYENNCANSQTTEDGSVLTFLVHSLGWMEVEENQLTSATSSKVIQKCIIELSTRGDNNAVRCWGRQTQQLVLKIENSCLKLYDMSGDTLLDCQPIQLIRVWGVNDNNDFAFVARDSHQSNSQTNTESTESQDSSPLLVSSPSSGTGLKCHVFHCEDDSHSAQRIATYLRDEMIRMKSDHESCGSPPIPLSHNQRPKHLFIYDSTGTTPSNIATPTAIEFPTPIEEPRKTICAKFLGKTQVSKPMGIEVLNEAIETILFNEPEDQNCENESSVKRYNTQVLVHISPSNITIESKETAECLAECRVRYLSFLGIGSNNVKHCGFIMQIDEKAFEALCFECEPSSGALCKTVEAACKLRYQKCLDAHRQRLAANNTSSPTNSSRIKSTIINVFSKISNNIRKN